MLGQLYQSLILYPKGLSQIAKTILSPVTHVRNFVSAGAFADSKWYHTRWSSYQDSVSSTTNTIKRHKTTE